MAAVIRIKRSTGTSAPGSLKTGEIAYSAGTGTSANAGDRMFFGKGDDGSGNATSVVVIGGEYFANLLDHTPGTLTASSAIIVDANSKVDQLLSGNIVIAGATNTITGLADPSVSSGAATKNYVDTQVAANNDLDVAGDTGTDNIELGSESLTFTGGTGLSSAVTAGTVTFSIDNTGVSASTYGSSTAIPVITVNAQGQITSATTASIASTLNLAGDAASSGSVSLLDSDLSIVGGEGIDVTASGNGFTIAGEDASTTNKGIASFNTNDFSVSSGAVSIKAGGVSNSQLENSSLTVTAGTGLTGGGSVSLGGTTTLNVIGGDGITANANEIEVTVDNSTIELSASDGSGAIRVKDSGITNAKLANSSVTIGSTSISLGASSTTLAGLTQVDIDNIRIMDNTVASSTGVLYIDPNPIDSDGGEVIVRGNLTVQGVTTTVNSTTVSINDKNLVLADSAANAGEADGGGLTIGGAGYSGTQATFTFNGSNDEWEMNKTLNMTGSTSLEFAGVDWKEVMEDHLATNYFLAGEGIDLTYVDGSNTLTISAELATATNAGVATFDETNFTVTSGDVAIAEVDGGTY